MNKIIKSLIILLISFNLQAEELPFVHWFNVYIGKTKAGYCYDILEKSKYEGKDCLKETIIMKIDVKRLESRIEAYSKSELFLKDDLTPLFFKTTENMTGQNKEMEGTLKGDKLIIKSKLADIENDYTLQYVKGAILDDSADEILRRMGYKVGDKFKLKIFSKDTMSFEDINIKVKDFRKEEIMGRQEDVYIVETEFSGILATHYIDKNGYTLKSDMTQAGLVMIKTTEEDAKKEFNGDLDVMTEFALKTNVYVEDPKIIKKMNISFVFQDGIPEKLKLGVKSKKTSITATSNNMLICSITKDNFDEKDAINLPVKGKEYEEFLKSTLYEQSDDAEIKNTAKDIVADEKNSYKAAKKIVNWVYKYITNKSFDIGFNSAKETLKLKQGDCTEHSVLASALCKAAGIPSKVCAGLVPLKNTMFYHMWIEVYAGKWVGMDPTFDEDIIDAAHVKLSDGILDEKGKFELLTDILKYFNKVEAVIFKLDKK